MLRTVLISASALSCWLLLAKSHTRAKAQTRREPCKIYYFPLERCVRRA